LKKLLLLLLLAGVAAVIVWGILRKSDPAKVAFAGVRAVKKGAPSLTMVQVVEGFTDGDAVALPSDTPLRVGERVTATM
jgi:hypothetical protein